METSVRGQKLVLKFFLSFHLDNQLSNKNWFRKMGRNSKCFAKPYQHFFLFRSQWKSFFCLTWVLIFLKQLICAKKIERK